jgi:hypothetical protein
MADGLAMAEEDDEVQLRFHLHAVARIARKSLGPKRASLQGKVMAEFTSGGENS